MSKDNLSPALRELEQLLQQQERGPDDHWITDDDEDGEFIDLVPDDELTEPTYPPRFISEGDPMSNPSPRRRRSNWTWWLIKLIQLVLFAISLGLVDFIDAEVGERLLKNYFGVEFENSDLARENLPLPGDDTSGAMQAPAETPAAPAQREISPDQFYQLLLKTEPFDGFITIENVKVVGGNAETRNVSFVFTKDGGYDAAVRQQGPEFLNKLEGYTWLSLRIKNCSVPDGYFEVSRNSAPLAIYLVDSDVRIRYK